MERVAQKKAFEPLASRQAVNIKGRSMKKKKMESRELNMTNTHVERAGSELSPVS